MRTEQEIFDELAGLCVLPGYLHAVCWFCFRDNIATIGADFTAGDLQNMVGYDRLIRTEIATLIGLALKGPLDLSLPTPLTMQNYITRTEELLREIHEAMTEPWVAHITTEDEGCAHPFTQGDALRESIFYGGESAYGFQYRDFSVQKYAADDAWITGKNGFTIRAAQGVVKAICDLQEIKILIVHQGFSELSPEQWTLLPGFEFSVSELAMQSGINENTIRSVVEAFVVPEGENNADFSSLCDFNIVTAYPLIRTGMDSFLLLQQYTLLEALYEAPFYWMTADVSYRSKAAEHRGRFTEEFSKDRLLKVFGENHVFSNVDLIESKGKRISEIDVLVVFGDRAIVLQAKSKRLTIEARKGNDLQIRKDFKKSIQDSYGQALQCAKALSDSKCRLIPKGGKALNLPSLEEIYILCVVSDHYPAIAFQARQFLEFESTAQIAPPFVMDIFTLDALTEMLSSPLLLLSYINRRTRYTDRLMATQELTILSYHLRNNLWFEDQYDMVSLGEDIALDLDAAMMVRRERLQGKATPEGILTTLADTSLGRLIATIESDPRPATIALGFMLLTLSERSVRGLSALIDRIVSAARKDGEHHDLTIGLDGAGTGLTVHCNNYPDEIAAARLGDHCYRRKYRQKATSWFGICLSPKDAKPRFGVNLKHEWEYDAVMEAATRRMETPSSFVEILSQPVRKGKRESGRNDPCPCGSGKKYKKCCLLREQ